MSDFNNTIYSYSNTLEDSLIVGTLRQSAFESSKDTFHKSNKYVPMYSIFNCNSFYIGKTIKDKKNIVGYSYKTDFIIDKYYTLRHVKSYKDFFYFMRKGGLNIVYDMRSTSGNNEVILLCFQGVLIDWETSKVLACLCIPSKIALAYLSNNSTIDKINFFKTLGEKEAVLLIDREFITNSKYKTWYKNFDNHYLSLIRNFDIEIIEVKSIRDKIYKEIKMIPDFNSIDDMDKYLSDMHKKLENSVLNG